MQINLKNYIYNELKVQSKDIIDTIKSFSAYLYEFDNDYKYTYKFLVSHIEDFEKAIHVHNHFKIVCLSVIEELEKDFVINNMFSDILFYKERLRSKIEFNGILTYEIKNTDQDETRWVINGTLSKEIWDSFLQNSSKELNINIEFQYDNFHFSRRFFNVNTVKKDFIDLIRNFYNDSYHAIVIEIMTRESIQQLKKLRISLDDEYVLSIIINEFQSLIISKQFEDSYLENNLIITSDNTNYKAGDVIIHYNEKNHKISKSRLNNIDLIANDFSIKK